MLPEDAKARKAIPIYSGFVKYFPDAIAAVAELSRIGNDQHNPGKPLHWDRSKSGDELDAMMRHILDQAGGTESDTDGVLHATKTAWRAMAHLQKLQEARKMVRAMEGPQPPAATENGWNEWKGGDCPVRASTRVEVKFRCGESDSGRPAGHWHWRWTDGVSSGDIVAWRLA